MRRLALVASTVSVLIGIGSYLQPRTVVQARHSSQSPPAGSGTALSADALDRLLAPIALYPDQLLAQMLLCATDPAGVKALDHYGLSEVQGPGVGGECEAQAGLHGELTPRCHRVAGDDVVAAAREDLRGKVADEPQSRHQYRLRRPRWRGGAKRAAIPNGSAARRRCSPTGQAFY